MTMETNGKQKVKLLHLYKFQLDFSRLPNVAYYGCKKLYSAVQVIVRKCITLLDKEKKNRCNRCYGCSTQAQATSRIHSCTHTGEREDFFKVKIHKALHHT